MSLLEELKAVGKYIDTSLLPNSNEIVPVVGALLHLKDHPEIEQTISDGRAAGKPDAEITADVGNVINPPPPPEQQAPAAPDAGATDQLAHENQALRDEVAELRDQFDRLNARLASGRQTTLEEPQG